MHFSSSRWGLSGLRIALRSGKLCNPDRNDIGIATAPVLSREKAERAALANRLLG
jgi:hypothetical protein